MKDAASLSSRLNPVWMDPFQRVTSAGSHVREIDGLRFIALAFVVLLHLNHYVVLDAAVPLVPHPDTSPLGRMLDQGDFGVRLFFAISGFILSLPFLKQYRGQGKPVSLKKYYLRRLTRLEPPLIINAILMLGLMVFVLKRPLGELFPHFFATCSYLHVAIFGKESLINPVTWSLEVEAQFYILMPLLAQLFRIRAFWMRQGVMLGIIVFFSAIQLPLHKASLTEQIEFFVVGFVVADWWLLWRERPVKKVIFDLWACVAWVGMLAMLYWNRSIPKPIMVGLPLVVVAAFLLSLRAPWVSRLLSHWVPVTLGGMCYTIYLYHLAIISAVSRVVTPRITVECYYLNYAIHAAILLPVVVGICMILFVMFERPFMRWNPWGRGDKRRA